MDSSQPAERSPKERYERRRQRRSDTVAELEVIDRRLATWRLLTALGWIVTAWAVFDPDRLRLAWLGAPTLLFVVLMMRHDRVLRRLDAARRGVAYYSDGLRRLRGELTYEREGHEYADDEHPFAADLDLFGPVSLYRLLCGARTSGGRRQVARWLLEPAAPEEILRRQAAVRELAEMMPLRERLAIRGERAGDVARPDDLLRWAAKEPAWDASPPGWQPNACAALLVLSIAGAIAGWWSANMIPVALLVQLLYAISQRRALERAGRYLDDGTRELHLLGTLLEILEQGVFEAPLLRELQKRIERDEEHASRSLARLQSRVVQLDSTRNMMFAPIAGLVLWRLRMSAAIERWRADHGPSVPAWIDAVAELEALASLATYHFERPEDPFPEIVDRPARYRAQALGHPLLSAEECVRNDVALDDSTRLLIVSGSNMSGKSTLMRSVGTSVVMAQMGAPVRAHGLSLSPLAVGASIRVSDSLRKGMSGFYAEIRRLRDIVGLADGGDAVLFLLEEILQTTNSHDRRVGARAVLSSLLERDAVGLVTTHDLAITELAEELRAARNVHFVDHLEGDQIRFDYRLRDGVVDRSNAIELMRSIGLDV